jgi:hypothetical protein
VLSDCDAIEPPGLRIMFDSMEASGVLDGYWGTICRTRFVIVLRLLASPHDTGFIDTMENHS